MDWQKLGIASVVGGTLVGALTLFLLCVFGIVYIAAQSPILGIFAFVGFMFFLLTAIIYAVN